VLSDQSGNPTAFNLLAKEYSTYRPAYPDLCLQVLQVYLGSSSLPLTEPRLAVDVGSGTGIWTRQMRQALDYHWRVIGLEPSEAMLAEAYRYSGGPSIEYIQGIAERMPLEGSTVSCIVAAQAVQWFDRNAFYREAHRVLCAGAVLAIIQNNRQWRSSPLLAQYEDLLERYNPEYNRGYRSIDFPAEVASTGLFIDNAFLSCDWTRVVTFDFLMGLSASSTKGRRVIEVIGEQEFSQRLWEIFRDHCDGHQHATMQYQTELYLFRKQCGR
jgi:ubiquinone/menaquinone biosynthesis C-methylase UbiE